VPSTDSSARASYRHSRPWPHRAAAGVGGRDPQSPTRR
jgi:hypothetical protein